MVEESIKDNSEVTKKKVNIWSRIGIMTAFLLWTGIGLIAAQVAVVFALVAFRVNIDAFGPLENTIIAAVVYVLTLSLVVGGAKIFTKQPLSMKLFGLERLPKWSEIGLALLGFIVYILTSGIVMSLVQHYVPGFDVEQAQDVGFNFLVGKEQYILAFLTLVIIAPVAEEMLFRGYLYTNLRRYAPWWVVAILVSALFGAVHMQWNVAIDTFVLSMFLCGLRELCGSIWPTITIHMMKNGLAFYFLFVNPTILNSLIGG